MMNWSAKDGARSSPHYRGEGVFIHPSHQGVCRRHGTEEPHVTPGGLARSSAGTEGKPTYKSAGEVEGDVVRGVGRPNST